MTNKPTALNEMQGRIATLTSQANRAREDANRCRRDAEQQDAYASDMEHMRDEYIHLLKQSGLPTDEPMCSPRNAPNPGKGGGRP